MPNHLSQLLSHLQVASSIKATGCSLFGPNVAFDDLKNGEKSNTALTCHRYRNIIVQSAQEKYKGSDARDIHAVMLGHKLSHDEGSRTTEIYGSYLTVCKRVFSTIRRIEDQMYLTDQDLEMRNLQEEMKSLKEENRQLHWKTHEGVEELLHRTDTLSEKRSLVFYKKIQTC